MERACVRIVDRTGETLTVEVAKKTPVAEPPKGAVRLGEVDEWLRSRGREPGTLKKSWRTSETEREGPQHWSVESYTEDPVAPHVEWDTSPHVIAPRNAMALRFWDEVGRVFRQSVFHPGTRGQHMMRDSLAELDTDWRRIGEEEVLRWSKEQARLVR
jgi:hypothetical protein